MAQFSNYRKVALLVETSSSYGRGLLRGICKYSRLHGPWTLFFEPSGPDQSIERLADWNVQGLITRIHTRGLERRITSMALPAVDLGYVLPDLFPWRISNHQFAVGKLAASHLLDRGFRSYAFCGLYPFDAWANVWEEPRYKSFRRTVRKAGFGVCRYEWPAKKSDWQWSNAQRHLESWLSSLEKPVGLFASNDVRGEQVLKAAAAAGIKLPDEMGVIGVDNDETVCELTTPTLTSIELNLERIGYQGAALLDKIMSGKRTAQRPIRIDPLGIVCRQSTDVVAIDDEIVADAVRFIRANANRSIKVADVLKAVPVCRKTLEVKFRQAFGHTPHDEIVRRRIEKIQELLIHTDWTFKRIAQHCGFRYTENLHAYFHRATLRSLSDFREAHRSD